MDEAANNGEGTFADENPMDIQTVEYEEEVERAKKALTMKKLQAWDIVLKKGPETESTQVKLAESDKQIVQLENAVMELQAELRATRRELAKLKIGAAAGVSVCTQTGEDTEARHGATSLPFNDHATYRRFVKRVIARYSPDLNSNDFFAKYNKTESEGAMHLRIKYGLSPRVVAELCKPLTPACPVSPYHYPSSRSTSPIMYRMHSSSMQNSPFNTPGRVSSISPATSARGRCYGKLLKRKNSPSPEAPAKREVCSGYQTPHSAVSRSPANSCLKPPVPQADINRSLSPNMVVRKSSKSPNSVRKAQVALPKRACGQTDPNVIPPAQQKQPTRLKLTPGCTVLLKNPYVECHRGTYLAKDRERNLCCVQLFGLKSISKFAPADVRVEGGCTYAYPQSHAKPKCDVYPIRPVPVVAGDAVLVAHPDTLRTVAGSVLATKNSRCLVHFEDRNSSLSSATRTVS
eukprot:gene9748-15133_t